MFSFVEILTCCAQLYVHSRPSKLESIGVYTNIPRIYVLARTVYRWIHPMDLAFDDSYAWSMQNDWRQKWVLFRMKSKHIQASLFTMIGSCGSCGIRFIVVARSLLSCFPQSEVRLTKMRPKPATQLCGLWNRVVYIQKIKKPQINFRSLIGPWCDCEESKMLALPCCWRPECSNCKSSSTSSSRCSNGERVRSGR